MQRGRRRITMSLAEFLREVGGDHGAMEAAVLDEDLVRPLAGDDHAGNVESGHVGLQRLGLADRAARVAWVELYTERLDKGEVRVIPGQREDEVVADGLLALGRLQRDRVF